MQPVKIYLTQDGKDAGIVELEVTFKAIKGNKLKIGIVKATLKEDLDIFNKMDPFVTIQVGTVTKRTTIKQEAGKTPTWNE
jgi:Ca2+-dependent lipid-binding protein